MDQLVDLNVGGSCFTTTLTTLSSAEGTLGAMFGGNLEPTLLRDKAGRFFIDRDGKHFGKILNYLRDGTVPLPATREARRELRAEADYFSLTPLVQEIDAANDAAVRAHEAGSAAMASTLADARAAVEEARELCSKYAVLGTTKQTELALRLPALTLQLQAEILRVVDAGVRAAVDAG